MAPPTHPAGVGGHAQCVVLELLVHVPTCYMWFSAKEVDFGKFKKETMQKHISREQNFSFIVLSSTKNDLNFGQNPLTIGLVHGFQAKTDIFDVVKKRMPLERAPQEEQNGTNFSLVAPSSEEL